MYCWCRWGDKMNKYKGEDEDFKYFTSEDAEDPVTRNEFLQDFVVSRLSEIGEEIIAGREMTAKDITDRIAKDIVEQSSKTADRTINAKAMLLSCWLESNYGDNDSVIDSEASLECLESEIYSGMNSVIKIKHGD